MNCLLAIDQFSAEWMSSEGQTGNAAAGETVSRGGETRAPVSRALCRLRLAGGLYALWSMETVEFDNTRGDGVVQLVLTEDKAIYLTVGGVNAYQTGFWICDTCRYIFSKVMGAQQLTEGVPAETAAEISAMLRDVQGMPDEAVLTDIARVLMPGSYSVVLTSLEAHLVMPGQPEDYFAAEAVATWGVDPYFGVGHSPETPYYRLGTRDLGRVEYGGKRLGVVLGVPLFPPTQKYMNNQDTVSEYRKLLAAGETQPTVLALGLVDDRGPATWEQPTPEYTRHLIVTLYVLDGHTNLPQLPPRTSRFSSSSSFRTG
jgi:hypothetical protein